MQKGGAVNALDLTLPAQTNREITSLPKVGLFTITSNEKCFRKSNWKLYFHISTSIYLYSKHTHVKPKTVLQMWNNVFYTVRHSDKPWERNADIPIVASVRRIRRRQALEINGQMEMGQFV